MILRHDGLVDKLVGDEVIGLFFGGVSGPRHAAAAVAAAIELGQRVGRGDASPTGAIPIGAGVHTGEAYVGTTGPAGAVDDFTALGDVVNTTARLASTAAAGEIMVTVAAADAAEYDVERARATEPGGSWPPRVHRRRRDQTLISRWRRLWMRTRPPRRVEEDRVENRVWLGCAGSTATIAWSSAWRCADVPA